MSVLDLALARISLWRSDSSTLLGRASIDGTTGLKCVEFVLEGAFETLHHALTGDDRAAGGARGGP